MIWFRRKRRWSAADVSRAEAIMRRWWAEHPGGLVWFAADPVEEAEVRERYEGRGVAVVPVYPGCGS